MRYKTKSRSITVGDRVRYQDKLAYVCRDRCNGMIDIEYDLPRKYKHDPDIHVGRPSGESVRCLYKDEVELVRHYIYGSPFLNRI